MKNNCGIYKITSPSNRVYIGQSKNIKYRWNQYKYFYEDYQKSLISKSIKKYGYDAHKFQILEVCEENELNDKEIYWINVYKSNIKKYPSFKGLNFTDGGNLPPSTLGRKFSEEEKNNISIKNKIKHSEKRIKNIKQYEKNGKIIKIWQDPLEFSKDCEFSYHLVKKCCKGENLSYKNFIWRYENDEFNKYKVPIKKEKKIRLKFNSPERLEFLKTINLGKIQSEETKKKRSESLKKLWTKEKKESFSLKMKGRKAEWKKGKQSKELIEKRISKIRK